MLSNLNVYHRRSIRLKDYDYSQEGAYFVTVCTQNHECLFGEIVDGQMVLNAGGQMVQMIWDEILRHYPGIEIDQFQIMPNHIHGIIFIVGAGPRACPDNNNGQPCCVHGQPCNNDGQPQGVAPTGTGLSLCDVVHRLKTMTTKKYCDGKKQYGWPVFTVKLWQRNYYEHIIRSDEDMRGIREYIFNNPANWQNDENNQAVKK